MWEWKRLRYDRGVLARRLAVVELSWLALVGVLLVGGGVHSAAAGVVFLLGVIVNGWILIPAFMVRVVTIGIYVGDRGLKIRNSIRTYILHWDEIRGVEEGPICGNMKAIWIITKRGKRIETQVHCWVGPKSYMRREKIGSTLSETEFTRAMEELRGRISAAAR